MTDKYAALMALVCSLHLLFFVLLIRSETIWSDFNGAHLAGWLTRAFLAFCPAECVDVAAVVVFLFI